MASSYPASLDSFTNPAAVDPLNNPAHAAQHANANDAVEAIEATLGTNPQGVYATVAARLGQVDAVAASAAVSASAAAVSASTANTAATNANSSALLAEEWAIKLIDPVEGSEYSAKYWAQAASVSASLAASLYDQFDDRFLGAKASDPSVDNDGNPLQVGALYFNTTNAVMRVWTGTAWVNAVDTPYNWTGPIAVSASSASPAFLITQLGSGDVLRLNDESGDTSPLTISSTGALLTYSTVTASTPGRFQGHGAVTQCTSTTRPGSPDEGDIIYETDTDLFYGWNGSAWTSIGGGGAAYQSASPSSPLTGSLWVDSDTDVLYIWDSAAWVEIGGGAGSTITTFEYTATAGQTTFSGLDLNGVSLAYTVGAVQVFLNGTMLQPGDDYTASNGTSIVLASGAVVGDSVGVVAFATFSVANTYTKAEVDALLGTAGFSPFLLMGA